MAARTSSSAPTEAVVRGRSVQLTSSSFCAVGCRGGRRPARRVKLRERPRAEVDLVFAVEGQGSRPSRLARAEGPGQRGAAGLLFGAFAAKRPGTRQLSLQGCKFYAFSAPQSKTAQLGVWRRLGDCVEVGYGDLGDAAECRVRVISEAGESLTPGKAGKRVGPLADLYEKRPYDRNAWIYWECFWAPVGPEVWAQKAGYVAANFRPLLAPGLLDGPEEVVDPFNLLAKVPKDRRRTPDLSQAPAVQDAHYTRISKSQAFSQIYQEAVWPGLFSASGPGSDPFHPMVRLALSALDMAVDSLGVRTLLDAACGDAEWICRHFLDRRPELDYVGVDIVHHVVQENRERHPNRKFLVADLGNPVLREPLPKVDMIFSKETLNHMYIHDVVHALQHFQATGARWLVTNITKGSPNFMGAQKGGHQNYVQYDYALPPFNLRKLRRLLDCNQDDWTEFAVYSLQP